MAPAGLKKFREGIETCKAGDVEDDGPDSLWGQALQVVDALEEARRLLALDGQMTNAEVGALESSLTASEMHLLAPRLARRVVEAEAALAAAIEDASAMREHACLVETYRDDALNRVARATARADQAEAALAEYVQTSGDLCPVCGWCGIRGDDGCAFCALDSIVAWLRNKPDAADLEAARAACEEPETAAAISRLNAIAGVAEKQAKEVER